MDEVKTLRLGNELEKLHTKRISLEKRSDFVDKEIKRLEKLVQQFINNSNKYSDKAEKLEEKMARLSDENDTPQKIENLRMVNYYLTKTAQWTDESKKFYKKLESASREFVEIKTKIIECLEAETKIQRILAGIDEPDDENDN